MKFFRISINLLIIIAFLSYSLPACSAENQPNPRLATPGFRGTEPFRIGVASMITPVDSWKYYMEIVEYIGEKLERPVRMIQRRTYDEMDILLEKGEVKVACV